MTVVSKNLYICELDKIVDKYKKNILWTSKNKNH